MPSLSSVIATITSTSSTAQQIMDALEDWAQNNIDRLGSDATTVLPITISGGTGTLRINASIPKLRLSDTDETLPAGLWDVRTNSGALQLVRNTAAGGDFSTSSIDFRINSDGTIDLLGGVNQDTVTTPTFVNSWTHYGAPYANAGYWKDPFGNVHLRGAIKSGTVAANAFVLPAGYLPSANLRVPTVTGASADTFGVILITSAGGVQPAVGNNAFFSLDGIVFRAA